MSRSKFALRSKTVIFNLAIGLMAAVGMYSGQIEELMGREAYLIILLGTVAVNLVLRSITSDPVTFKLK